MRSATPSTASVSTYAIQGRTVTIPVVVRDAMSVSAMFVVPTGSVQRLLPPVGLQVPELWPGRTLCVLAAIEYRDNDLGQYNEFAVNFFVRHGGGALRPFFDLVNGLRRHDLGGYIHRLPVTTSFSCAAGREIWGYPKTVEHIILTDGGKWRTCTVVSEGAHVLTLSVKRGGRSTMPDAPQDTFAWRNGQLLRTASVMGGHGMGVRLGGARLTLGEHPIADELRTLGLPRRALLTSSIEHMHARFNAPEIVAERHA